jgi:hypothetical protein
LANFLSISPNQTRFLPSVCLVPGLDFSAIPVSNSAVSSGRLSTYTFLDFKVVKWAVSSLLILPTAEFFGRNCLLENRKKILIAKFLMRSFTCRSTFLYGMDRPETDRYIAALFIQIS